MYILWISFIVGKRISKKSLPLFFDDDSGDCNLERISPVTWPLSSWEQRRLKYLQKLSKVSFDDRFWTLLPLLLCRHCKISSRATVAVSSFLLGCKSFFSYENQLCRHRLILVVSSFKASHSFTAYILLGNLGDDFCLSRNYFAEMDMFSPLFRSLPWRVSNQIYF